MSMVDEVEKVREMISAREVMLLIPIDRASMFRMERDGLFPQGHWVNARKKLWFKDEVVKWQRDLADPSSELSKAVRLKFPKTKGE